MSAIQGAAVVAGRPRRRQKIAGGRSRPYRADARPSGFHRRRPDQESYVSGALRRQKQPPSCASRSPPGLPFCLASLSLRAHPEKAAPRVRSDDFRRFVGDGLSMRGSVTLPGVTWCPSTGHLEYAVSPRRL